MFVCTVAWLVHCCLVSALLALASGKAERRQVHPLGLLAVRAPGLQLLEEVVALVVNEDESREVLNSDLPDSLHAKLRILYTLDALDRALRENSSNAADCAEIEAAVLLASVCHHL